MTERQWSEIFSPGEVLYIREGGRLAANSLFVGSSIVEIVDVSQMNDIDGDWPQSVTVAGKSIFSEKEFSEVDIDNIYLREAIERGDVEVVQNTGPTHLLSGDTVSITSQQRDVLEAIFQSGKRIEEGRGDIPDAKEGFLRRAIMVQLEVILEGLNVGPETLRGGGKNDILIRSHDGSEVVCECGIWRGPTTISENDGDKSGNSGKVDQLIHRYKQIDDNLGVVVLFSQNKNFEEVLSKVSDSIKEYPKYEGELNKENSQWWTFRCHTRGGPPGSVTIALMMFDVYS